MKRDVSVGSGPQITGTGDTARALLPASPGQGPVGTREQLRVALDEVLTDESARGRAVVVVKLDLDGFKDVNAAYGRDTGDAVLDAVGKRMGALRDDGWSVAHTSGDTFAAFRVLPVGVTGAGGGRISREVADVRSRVGDTVVVSGHTVPIHATMGVALVRVGSRRPADGVLRRAEVAMHRAKREHVAHAQFDASLDHEATHRLARIAELRSAVDLRQIVVVYQPIVDLATGECTSVEALARWLHPERGLVGPGEFISLAESCGLIGGVTRLVLEQVLRDTVAWRAAGFEGRCAVNVSAPCLTDPTTGPQLVEILTASADRVSIEVTESVMADMRAVAVLDRLHRAGVGCAIDDFGTGYSSLGSLKRLPVSTLKIDRSLVADVASDRRDLELVAAVVRIARSVGVRLVAEGIEDEATAEMLRGVGVTESQGYHFARPMTQEAFLDWLSTRSRMRAGPGARPGRRSPAPDARRAPSVAIREDGGTAPWRLFSGA